MRAAAIAYRNKDGYATADKAVAGYMKGMDRKSATQVGALWTIANAMSRMAVTPKPERIRYDGIAARANMQLCLILLEADQVEAAQGMIRQIAYHEGWLKNDAATRGMIAQVRARVKATDAMMDYLATQYQPAIRNDVGALTAVYLYGRYVKGNEGIVADLPGRVPGSSLTQLASSIDAAGRDPVMAFAAAENLRVVAGNVPEGLLRQRTLYAALVEYRAFLTSPATERDRIRRTLARMSLEQLVADGARGPAAIDPFAVSAPATQPAGSPGAAPGPTTRPMEDVVVGMLAER
jgi:hypothetical protein